MLHNINSILQIYFVSNKLYVIIVPRMSVLIHSKIRIFIYFPFEKKSGINISFYVAQTIYEEYQCFLQQINILHKAGIPQCNILHIPFFSYSLQPRCSHISHILQYSLLDYCCYKHVNMLKRTNEITRNKIIPNLEFWQYILIYSV